MGHILNELLYTLFYVIGLTITIQHIHSQSIKKNIIYKLIIIVVYTITLTITTSVEPTNHILFLLANLLCILTDFVYSCFLIQKKDLNNIFITAVYFCVYGAVGTVVISIIMIASKDLYNSVLHGEYRYLIPIISNIVTILICRFSIRNITFINQSLPKKYSIYFLVINLGQAIVMILLNIIMLEYHSNIVLIIDTLTVVQMVFIDNYIIKTNSIFVKNEELQLVNYTNELVTKHITEIEAEQEKSAKFRHDIKNHLLILSQIIEEGEDPKTYINNLNDDLNKTKKLIHTGNTYVDACINTVVNKDDSINYDFDIRITPNIEMNEGRLCSLLFNLLDNTKEAASKTQDKKVFFKLETRGEMLIIKVINSVLEKPSFVSNKGIGHGKGLVIIKEIVSQHSGNIDIKYDNNQVIINILLNLDEKTS